MAGVKGKSGGPRKNSGGARPGAGRKPKAGPVDSTNAPAAGKKEPAPLPATDDPVAFLLAVQNHQAVDIKTRVRAAIAAAQYKSTKLHDGGKRDAAKEKAGKAAKGRFGVRSAPLKLVGGG